MTAAAVVPATVKAPKNRDRYIDLLRALAMIRVVTYHLTQWAWLPFLFPSMGIMFALAGSLTAASLDRAGPGKVVFKRLRRLLPSLWAMGLIMVPIMLLLGWTWDSQNYVGRPLDWHLVFWLLPLGTPPGSQDAAQLVLPLWYLRTYTWLVLLSPVLLWLYRRWPMRTVMAPLLVVAAFASGLVVPNGSLSDELTISLAVFSACWIMGFALYDKKIPEIRASHALALAALLMLLGALWAYTHQDPVTGWNIDEIPAANAAYSLGAVLLVLRFRPPMGWLAKLPTLQKLISVMNARALTIYLWGNVAITAAIWADHQFLAGSVHEWSNEGAALTFQWVIAWAFICGFVLALGWVEDVAAGRPVRINPWPRNRAPKRVREDGGPLELHDDPRPALDVPVRDLPSTAALEPSRHQSREPMLISSGVTHTGAGSEGEAT